MFKILNRIYINRMQSLTEQQLITYQQLFSLFDKDDTGSLPLSQLHLYIRGLGHCPSEAELKQMKSELANESNRCSFRSTVQSLLTRAPPSHLSIEEELLEAFDGIQSDTGAMGDGQKNCMMSVKEAKKMLMEFGEKFSEAEADKFHAFICQNNLKVGNQFNYRDLVKIMAYGYY